MERHQEALDDAEEACVLQPQWPKAWARKAKAHTCLKQSKLAASSYAKGLEASLKLHDEAQLRHAGELDALKSQTETQSRVYDRMLQENMTLRAQLEDYKCMFNSNDKSG